MSRGGFFFEIEVVLVLLSLSDLMHIWLRRNMDRMSILFTLCYLFYG